MRTNKVVLHRVFQLRGTKPLCGEVYRVSTERDGIPSFMNAAISTFMLKVQLYFEIRAHFEISKHKGHNLDY